MGFALKADFPVKRKRDRRVDGDLPIMRWDWEAG